MYSLLDQIINKNDYVSMNKIAKSNKNNSFLYSEIAKTSIDYKKTKD